MTIVSRRSAAKLQSPAASGPKRAFITTSSAGFWVARQRIPGENAQDANGAPTHLPKVGHVLWLTDMEAQYELSQGAIALMDPQPRSEATADVDKAPAAQKGAPAQTPASAAAPAAQSAS